jgi:hypothetical protein
MQAIEVGKPFSGTNPIPESVIFEFEQSGGFLRVAWTSPSQFELKQFADGKIKLGLLEIDGIIFILVKFGSMSWMDAPYHVKFFPPYDLEDLTDSNKGYLINYVMLDAKTRIVKVLKLLEMPHEMSLQFKKLVMKQGETSIDGYDQRFFQIYKKHSTNDLVKMAKTYDLVKKDKV